MSDDRSVFSNLRQLIYQKYVKYKEELLTTRKDDATGMSCDTIVIEVSQDRSVFPNLRQKNNEV